MHTLGSKLTSPVMTEDSNSFFLITKYFAYANCDHYQAQIASLPDFRLQIEMIEVLHFFHQINKPLSHIIEQCYEEKKKLQKFMV